MKKMVSIKTKLISSTMVLISVIFACVLSVIIIMNVMSVEKNIAKQKKSIMDNLISNGKTLVKNNSMAMTGMAEDNAFTAIQALVSSTVKDDDYVSYGIYMNENNIPWVYATSDNPEGTVSSPEPLNDSMTQWAAALEAVSYRTHYIGNLEFIEFAAPVTSEDEKLGCIRYGLSTKKMYAMIDDILAGGRVSRNISIGILLLLGTISLATGYILIKQIATKITRPIGSLVTSAQAIAGGNYNTAVTSDSNDEIGNLAEHFETMRATIKQYTDHLQDLIDEKMQQVNDILNNIDQGLFTINLDGTVNKEYSARANEILKVDDIASYNLNQLLRLDGNQKRAFDEWLKLVKTRHASQRWKKLTKLAPVQELELLQNEENSQQYVAISYQKVFDKAGNLSKIMILAMDETEKRMKDLQMAAERFKHENEVKAILGIANTPPEEIVEFMDDTKDRLFDLHKEVKVHMEGVIKQRTNHPDGPEYVVTKEKIDAMYRHIHTIKGNAGSYGFELISAIAHKAEDMLEELRQPVKMRRGDSLGMITEYLGKMDEAMEDIHQKIKLVFGKDDEITVRIPENRILKIQDMCKGLESKVSDNVIKPLAIECMMLTWKPLKTLTRKYLKIIQRAIRKQNKNVEFEVVNDAVLYPADELCAIDDAILHLMRNAVDHGIEEPEVREEMGKGIGRIKLEYSKNDRQKVILISDDGRGIDTEKLVEKSIQKGIIKTEDLQSMTEQDKLMLMFHAGISTADAITDTSGRGVGMNVVKEKIEGLGGKIEINTRLGKGTTFTIILPS
ncbi:MAG: HAMP domain-containing protein [Chitinispirillaceae bacterium]|nr:HAMP domain-containing protein [Chitinispirillaceae bacterium]